MTETYSLIMMGALRHAKFSLALNAKIQILKNLIVSESPLVAATESSGMEFYLDLSSNVTTEARAAS